MPSETSFPTGSHERTSSDPRLARLAREEAWVVGFLLLCGLLPWVGYAALGAWDGRELGISLLLLVFTLRGLLRSRRKRGTDHARPSSGTHAADDCSRPFMRTQWTSHT